MECLHTRDVDTLFETILELRDLDECYAFFEDACTIREILEIAQRFRAARMLHQGEHYQNIRQKTGMSTTTISRVSRCLEYGDGGYKKAIDRLEKRLDGKETDT